MRSCDGRVEAAHSSQAASSAFSSTIEASGSAASVDNWYTPWQRKTGQNFRNAREIKKTLSPDLLYGLVQPENRPDAHLKSQGEENKVGKLLVGL